MVSHAGPSTLFNKTMQALYGGGATGAYAHPPPPTGHEGPFIRYRRFKRK